MLHIEFITDLGAKVMVDVERPEQLLDIQRHYGRLGWTSGEVPAGGYTLPLDNEADFDWSLLGARQWANPEGETMIMHRGTAYRRRELEAVDSRKMRLPKAVKYSRGARPTDPEHIREKADGDIEYVTLAIFRGGRRQERFAVPQGSGAQSHGAQAAGGPRQPQPERAGRQSQMRAQAGAPAQAAQPQQPMQAGAAGDDTPF